MVALVRCTVLCWCPLCIDVLRWLCQLVGSGGTVGCRTLLHMRSQLAMFLPLAILVQPPVNFIVDLQGTPASNPVILARLFMVLKAVLSMYTKKDRVLLGLGLAIRHK